MAKIIHLTEDKFQNIINEANVYDTGSDNATYSKNIVIQRSLFLGDIYFSTFTGEVVWGNTQTPITSVEPLAQFVKARMEIMKNHLEETLSKLESKMNNLDSNINLRHSPLQPFPYTCKVYYKIDCDFTFCTGENLVKKQQEVEEILQKCREIYGDNCQTQISGSSLYLTDNQTPRSTVDYRMGDKYILVGEIPMTGYKTSVEFALQGFQLGGLSYVGMVIPYINADITGQQFADVKLTDQYSANADLADYLKDTSSNLRCDSCGRRTSRDTYFIFQDEQGKLHYYGKTCAQKVFGIDIVTKLQNLIKGIDMIGSYVIKQEADFGLKENAIRDTIALMNMKGALTAQKFDYKNFVSTPSDEDAKLLSDYKEKNSVELNNLYNDFISNGRDFFTQMNVAGSDFNAKIQAFGLSFVQGDVKAFRKVPLWVIPYAINKYFKYRKSQELNKNSADISKHNGNIQPYGVFDGYKTFYATVVDLSYFKEKDYYTVMAKASDTPGGDKIYGIMWYIFSRDLYERYEGKVPFKINDNVTVSGTYSKYNRRGSLFTTIDRPTVAKTGEEQVLPTNISNGDRLRNCIVTVKKAFPKSIVVTTDDGCEFLIYTTNYGTDINKFGIDFTVGQKLKVTGTVQTSPRGVIYLNRCQVSLP